MRFLLDNPVSWRVGRSLRAAGHDALHAADLGMAGAPDTHIYAHSVGDRRVIITQDSDFGAIHEVSKNRVGVVLLRLSDGRPSVHAQVLLGLLGRIAEDLERGAFVLVEDEIVRVRPNELE